MPTLEQKMKAALSSRDLLVEGVIGQIERIGPVSFLCIVMQAYEAMEREAKISQDTYMWPPKMYGRAAKGVRKAWDSMFDIF